MTSRCLGLEEPLTLSLWLKTAEAYLIPTDLLTHLCVGKERGSFGVWGKRAAGLEMGSYLPEHTHV